MRMKKKEKKDPIGALIDRETKRWKKYFDREREKVRKENE